MNKFVCESFYAKLIDNKTYCMEAPRFDHYIENTTIAVYHFYESIDSKEITEVNKTGKCGMTSDGTAVLPLYPGDELFSELWKHAIDVYNDADVRAACHSDSGDLLWRTYCGAFVDKFGIDQLNLFNSLQKAIEREDNWVMMKGNDDCIKEKITKEFWQELVQAR